MLGGSNTPPCTRTSVAKGEIPKTKKTSTQSEYLLAVVVLTNIADLTSL